jgi:two-component system, OmpR family, alkaline phosphatase synthesis response regulator PhoP
LVKEINMERRKICIIEDQKDIILLVSFNLEKEGYKVVSHETGENALEFVTQNSPDLILLDIMIPHMDGFEVIKELKREPKTCDIPVIFLSAKSEETNIVSGLELGADDYITKPFSVAVLVARIRALLRKQKPSAIDNKESLLSFENIKIYPDRYEVYVDDKLVKLNNTEIQLLTCLIQHPGRVFSRNQIIDFMKGESYFVTDRLVDVLLVSIRKKLGPISKCIQTVRGVGYKIKALN